MRRLTMALAAIAVATFSPELVAQEKPAAPATPPGVQIKDGVFTDAKGMTLYTYARDTTANKSACAGQCLQNWPPLAATDTDKDVGDWKVITRDDGKKMWAYKGKPIYYYAQDKKAGDKIGDGRGGVWHIAKP